MIQIENLHKRFKKIDAVDGFSCSLGNGIYGLLGPNGAGKTTLIRCIANLYKASEGSITLGSSDGKSGQELTIGYLPQKYGMFPNLTVQEMMKYFCVEKDVSFEEIDPVLEKVSLTEKKNAKISALSGGMVRRLGIAQAIVGSPDVILLDEPTVGLDPEERINFKNIISKITNTTVILSTHIVSDVDDVCDSVLVMNKGKLIYQGTPDELKQRAKEKVYFVPRKEKDKLKGEYILLAEVESDSDKFYKILSKEKQPFMAKAPSLEDGYICCLKNI